MEMISSSDSKTTETYMIPGIAGNPNVALAPPSGVFEYNTSYDMPPSEYLINQGLSYPSTNNYGYYYTGFEPPGEWGDHHSFLGLAGQNLPYSGLQSEGSPYVYYTPLYGYAHSSPDQYGPLMHGGLVGMDGPFLGTQQYIASPTYQPPISPSAYVPVIVQPIYEHHSSPNKVSAMASRPSNIGKKSGSQASVNAALSRQTAASASTVMEAFQSSNEGQSTTKSSEGRNQDESTAGKSQAIDQVSHRRISSPNPVKITVPSNSNLTNFGRNASGQFNGNMNQNVLIEQNRGPRTNKSKESSTPGLNGIDQAKAAFGNPKEGIIVSSDHYNLDDFPVDYPVAKFFVIKSYSEDDVHKSIKYNVWSSTVSGNRKLDGAYEDARKRSVGKTRNCPVFLFFSVNASGQFCGVAEMVGPVDFHTDMDFWQQDKWSGCFPVKWHIIKDVPNAKLRHIILENNENKPVTNSRDTQEIPYNTGINILKIFKTSPLMTSVLDDFAFYEERQKVMMEEKCRRLGRSYDAALYVPAFVSASNANSSVGQSAKENQLSGKELASGKAEKDDGYVVNQPSKASGNGKQPNGVDQSSKAAGNGKQPNGSNKPAKSNGKQLKGKNEKIEEMSNPKTKDAKGLDNNGLSEKFDACISLDGKKQGKAEIAGEAKATNSTTKLRPFVNDQIEAEAKSSSDMAIESTPIDVVKVGSVHIKVTGIV